MFDTLFYIGRFQPFHNGHASIVKHALTLARHVVVLIGSPNSPRTPRNPFTFAERAQMIHSSFPQVSTVPLLDFTYDDEAWELNARKVMDALANGPRIGVIGCAKDAATAEYLKGFEPVLVPQTGSLNATAIRTAIFTDMYASEIGETPDRAWTSMVPNPALIYSFDILEAYEEWHAAQEYKEAWFAAPFEPKHVCVDAVVIHEDQVVLVTRGKMPGKGRLALPGGHLNPDETPEQGILRELYEETGLYGEIVSSVRAFTDPHRSSIGRVITFAALVRVSNIEEMLAADDAAAVQLVPLSELNELNMHDDHYHIIRTLYGRDNWI